jgi:hypothetical protein
MAVRKRIPPNGPASVPAADLANHPARGLDISSETGVDTSGTDHAPGNDVIVDT